MPTTPPVLATSLPCSTEIKRVKGSSRREARLVWDRMRGVRLARAAETLGVDHVGFGTDNSGFGKSQAVWTDYADFPTVVQLLRRTGFSAADVGKVVGGNYLRVLNESLRA